MERKLVEYANVEGKGLMELPFDFQRSQLSLQRTHMKQTRHQKRATSLRSQMKYTYTGIHSGPQKFHFRPKKVSISTILAMNMVPKQRKRNFFHYFFTAR